jgi:hypothetical protein
MQPRDLPNRPAAGERPPKGNATDTRCGGFLLQVAGQTDNNGDLTSRHRRPRGYSTQIDNDLPANPSDIARGVSLAARRYSAIESADVTWGLFIDPITFEVMCSNGAS